MAAKPRTPLTFAVLLVVALSALAAVGVVVARRQGQPQLPADPTQTQKRLEAISRLDVMRSGSVRLRVADLDTPAEDPSIFHYTISSPSAPVADADIRGFLDGGTKYLFNQGTSYHMRIGRRYNGPFHWEYELKRSLVKWPLPLPPVPGARVVGAQVDLWLEKHHTNSPLDSVPNPGLHVYAYPVEEPWEAGQGGIEHDDFSAPAPGEVSWIEARTGIRSWSGPGGLAYATDDASGSPYERRPLAVSSLAVPDTFVTLSEGPLTDYLRAAYASGRADLDLLLKVDDDAEDRWGTELAFLSSDFGSDLDMINRRPRLQVDLAVPYSTRDTAWDFVLEPGNSMVFPRVSLTGLHQIVALDVRGKPGAAEPMLWIRGGPAADTAGSRWRLLPRTRPPQLVSGWAWIQVRVAAAPHSIAYGDTFATEVAATWLAPGPRESQAPELALVAPSGTVHRVRGVPLDSAVFRLETQPRELGLWRYGWSFRPSPEYPLGAHQGEGLFYVGIPADPDESLDGLRLLADHLVSVADSTWGGQETSRITQLNNLVRWAALIEQTGTREDSAEAAGMVRTVRSAISTTRFNEQRP